MVFKEALANVVHHAAATEVSISVTVEGSELCCMIADNGHGLPPGNRDESMSGLANMKERIEKYGGFFNMESAAERGTTLRFKVPLN
jgi:signal transduction histidine kinase